MATPPTPLAGGRIGATNKRGIAAPLVDAWLEARRELREIEEVAHPDVTDALGRVWRWMDGDIYTHDGMAWPLEYITAERIGLPTQAALDNVLATADSNARWRATHRLEQIEKAAKGEVAG